MTDHQAKALRTMRQVHHQTNPDEEAHLRRVAQWMVNSEDEGERVIGGILHLRLSGAEPTQDLSKFVQKMRDAIERFDLDWARFNRTGWQGG